MGRSTCSDIVENLVYLGDPRFPGPKPLKILLEELESSIADVPLTCGWVHSADVATKTGKRGRLYADELEKDGATVYLVNISEYSNGGANEYVTFGERTAVEAFIADAKIGKHVEIIDHDSINQTL